MHEEQLIKLGVLFPFTRCEPWQLGSMGRQLHLLFYEPEVDAGDFLRKFWECCIKLQDMQELMVQK